MNTNLLNELNAGCQVHAKVNELPHDALFLVLFLFQHKHVVVEELLQLLIGKVDAQLLKGVKLYVFQNVKRKDKSFPISLFFLSKIQCI